jgi:hypothetical protein
MVTETKYTKIIQNLLSSGSKWRKYAGQCEEYFYGNVEGTLTQFTKEQQQKISKDYDIPVSINVLYPVIEQVLAFLTGNKPSIRVLPVGEADKNIAYKLNEIWTAVWYRSYGNNKMRESLKESLVTGSGYLLVEPASFYHRSPLDVIISHLPWKYVYVDPNAHEWDYSDAEYILISKSISKDKCLREFSTYGITEDDLKPGAEFQSGSGYQEISSPEVVLNDLYEKEFIKKGFLGKDGKVTKQPRYKGQRPLVPDVYIKRTLLVNDKKVIWSGYLPVNEYPVIHLPCTFHANGVDLKTYGLVHYLIDSNISINKSVAHMILNAQLHGNIKMIAPKGIIDPDEFYKWAANPKMLLEYDDHFESPGAGKPERLTPFPLPNAHYTLFQELIKMIEYISGVYAIIQGNPAGAPETFGGTQSLQAFGTQRIKMRASMLDLSLSKLCHCVINYIVFYSPPDKIFRYVNDSLTSMESNPQTGQMEQVQTKANEPWREVSIEGRADISDYDVVALPNPSTPTSRLLASHLLGIIAGQTRDPNVASLLTQYSLKLLDIPEADEIVEKVDTIKALQQQLQQMQQALQQISEQAQQLNTENQELKASAIEEKFSHQIEKHTLKHQAQVATAGALAVNDIGNIVSSAEQQSTE